MVRTADLPDLGAVTGTSRLVADKSGTGTVTAAAVNTYLGATYATQAALASETSSRTTADAALLPLAGGTITGNLSVNGSIASKTTVSADLFRLSALGVASAWQFSIGATGEHFQEHATGWFDSWSPATGTRFWDTPSGANMSLDGGGNLTATGSVAALQFWSGVIGQMGFGPGGSDPNNRYFQFAPGFFLDYVTAAGAGGSPGELQWVTNLGSLWAMRVSDRFCFNSLGPVGGNGAYVNSSDRRMKSNIAPTSRGLAEVLQLQPVEFDRDNPATGASHEIGFVAQDVQPIVPEAVWTAAIPLRDGTGGLDDPEPTLGITEATLTALNVNAIKELNALIAALTDRVAALEAVPGPP